MSSAEDRKIIEKAKLAEQAERYDDMAKVGMHWVIISAHVEFVAPLQS